MSVCQWRVSQDVKGTFTINHRGFHFPQTEALILVSTVGNFIHTLKMRKKNLRTYLPHDFRRSFGSGSS